METEFGDTSATRSERRRYARVGERACRFTEVRALDLLMEETMTCHGRSLFITRATLVRCVQEENFTIQDQEDKNSDRTEDRESVTPSSWMKLALDKQSAEPSSKAHHDKLKTVVRHHPAKRNQERCHNDKKLLDYCSQPRKQVALSGKTTQNNSFLTRESPSLTACELHGCKISC